jgi:hypothetical protein
LLILIGRKKWLRTKPLTAWRETVGLTGILGKTGGKPMKIVFAMLLALSCTWARAEVTGNDLLRQLQSSDAGETLRAYAYILGVNDSESINFFQAVFKLGQSKKDSKFDRRYACIPDGIIGQQVFDVVRRHLERNPEVRHMNGAVVVRAALNEAWPCRANP